MADNKLGKALLQCDLTAGDTAANARQQADAILRRDTWRVRALAGLTIFFAALGTIGISSLIYVFNVYISPSIHKLAHDILIDKGPIEYERLSKVTRVIFYFTGNMITWLGTCSLAALLLAFLAAVVLIFASRRAALRQVNVSLLEISRQLQELQQTMKKETPL